MPQGAVSTAGCTSHCKVPRFTSSTSSRSSSRLDNLRLMLLLSPFMTLVSRGGSTNNPALKVAKPLQRLDASSTILPILPHGPIRLVRMVRMVRKTLARLNLIHHPHEADGVFLKKVAPTNSLIFASIRASRMGATRGDPWRGKLRKLAASF